MAKRRARRRLILGLGAAATIALVIVVASSDGGASVPTPAAAPGEVSFTAPATGSLDPGETVPSFSAPALDGGRFTWSAGPPTVLALWAPWCPHCQAELPRLAAASARFPEIRLVSVAGAIGLHPGPSVHDYMSEHAMTFPVAIDDERGTLLSGLGVTSFPTVYYVGGDGRVVGSTVGEVDPGQLDALLSQLAASN